MRLYFLKPVEFETKNYFALKLTVHSNSHSVDLSYSNLTTTEFKIFCSEREGSSLQFIISNDSRFFNVISSSNMSMLIIFGKSTMPIY